MADRNHRDCALTGEDKRIYSALGWEDPTRAQAHDEALLWQYGQTPRTDHGFERKKQELAYCSSEEKIPEVSSFRASANKQVLNEVEVRTEANNIEV